MTREEDIRREQKMIDTLDQVQRQISLIQKELTEWKKEFQDAIKTSDDERAKVTQSRNRWIVGSVISALFILFAGVIGIVSVRNNNIATHELLISNYNELKLIKADQTRVDNQADWTRSIDAMRPDRIELYYHSIHSPARGGTKDISFNVRYKAVVVYSMQPFYTSDNR